MEETFWLRKHHSKGLLIITLLLVWFGVCACLQTDLPNQMNIRLYNFPSEYVASALIKISSDSTGQALSTDQLIHEQRRFPVQLARVIHLVSAFWTLGLAFLIFLDVAGRGVFSQPIPGTKEIIQNSIVAITFLQLPLAVFSGSMLRTTVLADAVPASARRVLRTFGYILGALFFVGLLLSSYQPLLDAIRIGEYEGEGALRVPTWPVRGLIFLMAIFGVYAYCSMIYYDWRGRLVRELHMPGTLSDESDDLATDTAPGGSN